MVWFRLTLSLVLFALGAAARVALPLPSEVLGTEKAIKLQTTCPISGEKLRDKADYADHEGHRVYFCCEDCRTAFKSDPASHIKKMQAQGITVAKLQTECPVMGGQISKASFVDRNGKRVYLCCDGCKGRVTDERMAELEAQGIVFEASPKN